MNGKNIVVIGALAAGAYLLLSGSGGSGGGAEGGGTKKATAITGVVPGFDGGSGGYPSGSGDTLFGGSPGGSPSAPFQPSQYLMDLIYQKINAPATNMTALTTEKANTLWSEDYSVSSVLTEAKKQGATVYTSPQKNDSRMVDYYVEIGDKPGQYNLAAVSEKPPTLSEATTKDGVNWTPVVTKKEANSSSSSSSSSSSAYAGSVANASHSGWSPSLHSRMGVA